MCGIVGYLRLKDDATRQEKTNDTIIDLIQELIFEAVSRGRSAAGYAFPHDGRIISFKRAGSGSDKEFVQHLVDNMTKYGVPESLIVHTRATTKGSEKNNENNHPIVSHDGRFALIHNGVISNDDALREEFKLKSIAEVDSEVIMRMFEKEFKKNKNDVKSTIHAVKETTKHLVGSFSCALIDAQNPGTLTLFRHSNPAALASDEENKVLWFGSTKDILESALKPTTLIWGIIRKKGSKDITITETLENKVLVISQDDAERFKLKLDVIDYKYGGGIVRTPGGQYYESVVV